MSGASGAATAERDTTAVRRRGSRFADKQIAHAVKDRRQVSIQSEDGTGLVTGWIYGMDDYHFGLVDSYGNTLLVHKSAAAVIRFEDEVVDEKSPCGPKILKICEPFRERVMRDHFSQTNSQ